MIVNWVVFWIVDDLTNPSSPHRNERLYLAAFRWCRTGPGGIDDPVDSATVRTDNRHGDYLIGVAPEFWP